MFLKDRHTHIKCNLDTQTKFKEYGRPSAEGCGFAGTAES